MQGTVYWDDSTKSDWRAEIVIRGKRFRKRSKNREYLESWIESVGLLTEEDRTKKFRVI